MVSLRHRILDRRQDRRAARDVVSHRALPIDGPAAALHAQVVGAHAGDVDPLCRLGQRQRPLVVLQEHERLADRLPGHRAMLGRAERLLQAAVGQRRAVLVQQSHGELDAEDPRHGVVDPRHGDLALRGQFLEVLAELAVLVGQHHHVHAGVDRQFDRFLVVVVGIFDRVDGVVIGDEETVETEFLLEDLREQVFLAGTFPAVPTAVGRHDGADARLDRGDISGQVDAAERGLVAAGIALIQPASVVHLARAIRRAAVADEMFGAGHDGERIGQICSLKAADGGPAQELHDVGTFRIAFVGPAPTQVAGDGHARGKDPVDAGGADFFGRDALDLLHQFRVAGAAQADVVRKNDGAGDVVVPVHGIDAIDQRDAQSRLQRVPLVAIHHVGPTPQGVVGLVLGPRSAAAQKRTQEVFLDIGGILQRALIGLAHLADLLIERHLRQQFLCRHIVGRKSLHRLGPGDLTRGRQETDNNGRNQGRGPVLGKQKLHHRTILFR